MVCWLAHQWKGKQASESFVGLVSKCFCTSKPTRFERNKFPPAFVVLTHSPLLTANYLCDGGGLNGGHRYSNGIAVQRTSFHPLFRFTLTVKFKLAYFLSSNPSLSHQQDAPIEESLHSDKPKHIGTHTHAHKRTNE